MDKHGFETETTEKKLLANPASSLEPQDMFSVLIFLIPLWDELTDPP